MIICAVSDSHGEIENLQKAFRRSVDDFGAQILVHLGDDYDDAQAIQATGIEIIQVPGIYSSYYQNEDNENRIVRNLGGWRFIFSHTAAADEKDLPDDADPQSAVRSGEAEILVHGHTHIPEIALEDGYIRINPGHLRSNDKRGYPPTFCIIDCQPNSLDVRIYQLYSAEVFQSRNFIKDEIDVEYS